MRREIGALLLGALLVLGGCATNQSTLDACLKVAVEGRGLPWVDWQNYWATADASSRAPGSGSGHLSPNGRGIDGALLDLEYQRIELIKFNLFDSNGTYADYVRGRDGVGGPALKVWPEMECR